MISIKPNSCNNFILDFHVETALSPLNPDSIAKSFSFLIFINPSSFPLNHKLRYVEDNGFPLDNLSCINVINGKALGNVANP